MTEAVMQMQATIKRNSEDLREELNDLERWENDIKSKNKGSSKGAAGASIIAEDLPPIRGTAPLVPKPKATPKEDPIVKAKEEGNEYYRRNQFDDAIRSYTKGILIDENNSATHILYANRAMCNLKLQKWSNAESDATTCVQMNRTYFKAFFRRALARRQLGKLEEAASDLQTVLVLSPGDTESQKELQIVNAELAKKRAANPTAKKDGSQAAQAAPKKKLVIEEVDDDEEDEEEEKAAREKTEREAAARREAQALAAVQAKKKAEHDAAVEAAKKKVKANPKIEEIDDEEESPKRQPTKGKQASPQQVQPRNLQIVLNPESFTVPKSFTEFEKNYNEIVKTNDEALLTAYVKKLDLSSMQQLMGSSMTSEILVDLLRIVRMDTDRSFAKNLLVALSTIRRLDEVVMFFESAEEKILEQALDSVSDLPEAVKAKFSG